MEKKKKTKKNANLNLNTFPHVIPKHFLPPPSPSINNQEYNMKILSQFFTYKPNMNTLLLNTLPKKIIPEQIYLPNHINIDLNNIYVNDMSFVQKVNFFRNAMKQIKIPWTEGHDAIAISNRDNIIQDSMKEFDKINIYKELKIYYNGEVNQDAGGLIREWITILFKKLQSPEEELFEMTDTSEITYKLHRNIKDNNENIRKLNFIGKIMGKALMEGLAFNACFNIIIFKIILDEEITLNDMVNIDTVYYKSLQKILSMKNDELSYFNFVSTSFNGEDVPLVINGENLMINENNVDYFIKQKIKFYVDKDKLLINEIKKGLFSVIPDHLIKIFTAEELSLVFNGISFIDVVDWKTYTEYNGYDKNDKIINDFWDFVNELNQEQLKRLLQFCTGSQGIPIGGFKSLISNRDNSSLFNITKVTYEHGKENFIKAHTCFNRLDIPCYPTKELLYKALKFIVDNDIIGFGID